MKTKLAKIANSLTFRALTIATFVGYLNNWTHQFPIGYSAGLNDHSVLSLEGIKWADPTKFVNDWFMESAPQPHWFFDVVTYIGAVTNQLSAVYFVYWCIGLIAFGFATTILARQWAPNQPFLASLAVTAVISVTPWYVVGSGSIMISQALPTVLAGQFMYLTLALLLTGQRKLIPYFAALIAIIHVQQGAVISIILIATFVAELTKTKKLDFRIVIGSLLSISFTLFGLILRPIAANLNDFIEVCEKIIPYHCAAYTWSPSTVVAFAGLITLAVLTFFLVQTKSRLTWITSVGLAATGLFSGMLLDHFQIGILGQLAQATNIYRLGVLVIPFTAWGIVYPLFRPVWNIRFFATSIIWSMALASYFLLGGWGLGSYKVSLYIALCIIAGATVLATLIKFSQISINTINLLQSIGIFAITISILASAFIAGGIKIRPLDIEFMPDRSLAQWGREVEQIVPVGEIILAPPQSFTFRLVTGRAVIADCKNIPYGGNAWKEWNQRITDLGGKDKCAGDFNAWDAKQLEDIAKKYESNYMIIDPEQYTKLKDELSADGWNLKLGATKDVHAVLIGKQ